MKPIKYLLIILSSCYTTAFSQNNFEFFYSPKLFNWPAEIIETTNHNYIFCSNEKDSLWRNDFFNLIKLNNTGDTIKIKTFKEIKDVIVTNLIKNTDSTFLGLGYYYESDTNHNFVIFCFNDELDIRWRKDYQTGGRFYTYIRCNYNSSGNIIFSAKSDSVVSSNPFQIENGIILYELSSMGDSIRAKQFASSTLSIEPYQIVEKPDKTGYFLFAYTSFFGSSGSYPNNYITEMDYDFNPIIENEALQFLSLRTNAKNLGNSKIIYTGWDGWQNQQIFETVTIVDANLEPVANQQIIITSTDTNVNLSHHYNLDFIKKNNIYVSGVYNLNDLPYQYEPSWILLTNLDSMLNKRWQKFYGGDAFYFPWSTLATSDGGCIVLGYRWDFNIADISQNEIFVLKVDSSGNITSIYGPEISTNEINIFPNPGTDVLNLSLLPNLKANRFELYDITGKLIFEKEIFSKMESFNVSFLKSGLYFYKIYTSDNNIYSGKWIKQ